MLTAAMPAVTRALQGVLPPAALRQLTQALGNCNQTLTHRGDVLLQPDGWTNAINQNGVYTNLPPSINDYNTYVNNVYGGNRGGNVFTNTNVANSIYNTNTTINGPTIVTGGPRGNDGSAGRPGTNGTPGTSGVNGLNGGRGIDGVAGRDGRDGLSGRDGGQGPAGPPGDPGAAGRNGADGRDGRSGVRGEEGPAGPPGEPGPAGPAGRDGRDGRDGGVANLILNNKFVVENVTARKASYDVVVDVTFDEETCELQVDKIALPEVVTGIEVQKYTLRYYGPDNGLGVGPNGG